jgi:O-acetyl-ADP-ribose deacetylase (regulator of RNase III)
MRVAIGAGEILILQGDISNQSTDAIINAANNHLWMGTGVAGAIKRKGGDEIERDAVAQGPIELGQAIITRGGKLDARHVIHAAAMGQDLKTDAEKIRMATKNALLLADQHRFSSISLPALGTGVGGFSPFHCAAIMLQEAIDILQTSRHLRSIQFVLFDNETHKAFEQELRSIFSSKKH